MSRTYRRQKGYVPTYVIHSTEPLKGVEAEEAAHYTDPDTWYKGRVPTWWKKYECIDGKWFEFGTGKAFGQRVAKWFGDHGYAWRRLYGKDVSKFIRSETQATHRAQARQELANYRKNEEYEVIIPRKNLLPWD